MTANGRGGVETLHDRFFVLCTELFTDLLVLVRPFYHVANCLAIVIGFLRPCYSFSVIHDGATHFKFGLCIPHPLATLPHQCTQPVQPFAARQRRLNTHLPWRSTPRSWFTFFANLTSTSKPSWWTPYSLVTGYKQSPVWYFDTGQRRSPWHCFRPKADIDPSFLLDCCLL